ncbi:MAG: hypothetical protein ACI4LI_00295 [Candidatus Fimenecus sp.]
MFAVKGNKQYTITKAEQDAYVAEGFDILDESGKLIKNGAGKQVPFSAYEALEKKCKALEAENKKLKAKSEK